MSLVEQSDNLEKASLLIVHYGDPGLLIKSLKSLNEAPNVFIYIGEIIIIDNSNSLRDNDLADLFECGEKIKIIKNKINSYSCAINIGVLSAKHDIIIISNNDIIFPQDADLKYLFEKIRLEWMGLITCQLINVDGSLQISFGRFPTISNSIFEIFHLDLIWLKIKEILFKRHTISKGLTRIQYAKGAFVITKKNIFEKVGGFYEELDFYGEDVLFCWGVKNHGYDVCFVQKPKIIHIDGASSRKLNSEIFEEKLIYAKLRCHKIICSNKVINKIYIINVGLSLFIRFLYTITKYSISDHEYDLKKALNLKRLLCTTIKIELIGIKSN